MLPLQNVHNKIQKESA